MMEDDKISQAKRAIQEGVRGLDAECLFNIVAFNNEVKTFRERPVPATDSNVALGLDFVAGLEAHQQTDIHSALLAALDAKPRPGRPHIVVFITDGKPTVGETDRREIASAVRKANGDRSRLFVFGLGDDVDTHLLDLLAEENHGTSQYLKPRAEIERELSALYRRIRNPVMTDPKITIAGGDTDDIYPERLGDLFAGEELTLVGRYDRGEYMKVVLRGRMEGETGQHAFETKKYTFETVLPGTDTDNEFLRSLWAGRKIAHLLDEIRLDGETQKRREEVIALSEEYGIITSGGSSRGSWRAASREQAELLTPAASSFPATA
jgi:Ca-activated chloride channel family protein